VYSKKIEVDEAKLDKFVQESLGDSNHPNRGNNEGLMISEPYKDEIIDVLIQPEPRGGKYPTVVAGEGKRSVEGYINEKGW